VAEVAQPQHQRQEMVATVGRPEVVAVEAAQLWLLVLTGAAMAALARVAKSGFLNFPICQTQALGALPDAA
jgi:hypothetical protein